LPFKVCEEQELSAHWGGIGLGLLAEAFWAAAMTANHSVKVVLDPAKEILEAWRQGRPIVPFLGAGVSVGAGFPNTSRLIAYFAKVQYSLEAAIYESRYPIVSDGVGTAEATYERRPSAFIADFGWPDVGQLNADLWQWILDKRSSISTPDEAVQRVLLQRLQDSESELADLITQSGKRPALLGDWTALLDHLSEGQLDLIDALFSSLDQGRKPTRSHLFLTFLTQLMGIRVLLTVNFDTLLEESLSSEGLRPRIFDIHRDADLPNPILVRKQLSLVKLHGSAYGLRLGERVQYSLEEDARARIRAYVPNDALLVVIGFSGWERRMMHVIADFARRGASRSSHTQVLWVTVTPPHGTHSPQLIEIEKQLSERGLTEALGRAYISDANSFLPELYFQIASTFPASARSYDALASRPSIRPNDTGRSRRLGAIRAPAVVILSDIQWPTSKRPAATRRPPSSWPALAAGELVSLDRDNRHLVWIDIENHHTIEGIVQDILDQIRRFDPRAPYLVLPDESEPPGASSYDLSKAVKRIREALLRGKYIVVLDSLESFGRPQLVHHGVPRWDRRTSAYKDFKTKLKRFSAFVALLVGVKNPGRPSWLKSAIPDTLLILTATSPGTRHLKDKAGNACTFAVAKELRELIGTTLKKDRVKAVVARPHKRLEHVSVDKRSADGVASQWCARNDTERLPKAVRACVEKAESHSSRNIDARALVEILVLPALLHRRFAEPGDRPFDEPEDAFALLSFLSVFRRPPPLPLVRAFIGRWLFDPGELETPRMLTAAYETLDAGLQIADETGLLRLHEGKTVWIPRDLHQRAYDALTAIVRVRTVTDVLEHSPCGVPAVILTALLASTLHLHAARVHFSDVYCASHDEHAFCEYVYHRVSGLRYLALVQSIIQKYKAHGHNIVEQFTAVDEALKTVKVDGHYVFLTHRLQRERRTTDNAHTVFASIAATWPAVGRTIEMVGPFSFVRRDHQLKSYLKHQLASGSDPEDYSHVRPATALKALHYAVYASRRHGICTLHKAFLRERDRILSTTTPETSLGWIDQLLDYELTAVSGCWSEMRATHRMPPTFPLPDCDDPEVKELDSFTAFRDEADQLLSETKLQLLRKKLNFAKATAVASERLARQCAKLSRRHSFAVLHEDLTTWRRHAHEPHLPLAWTVTEQQLEREEDLSETACALLRHVCRCWLELARAIAATGKLRPPRQILDALLPTGDAAQVDLSGNVLRSMQYDCRLLQSELDLGELPMWSYFEKEYPSFTPPSATVGQLQDVERNTHHLEDMVRMECDRASDYAIRKSGTLALRARALYLRGQFRDAHRVLNHALCDLQSGREQHKRAHAVVHIFRAELLAISAHVHLAESRTIGSSIRKVETGLELLETASDLLEPAGHRPLWWLRLHIGRAQLRHEQILYDIAMIADNDRPLKWTFTQRSLWLEQCVMDGLASLRIALDTLPFRNERFRTGPQEPLLAAENTILGLWSRLLVVAFAHTHIMAVTLQLPRLVSAQPETMGWFEYYSWTREVVATLETKRVHPLAELLDPQGFWDRKWGPWCKARQFLTFSSLKDEVVGPLGKCLKMVTTGNTVPCPGGARRSSRDDILAIESALIVTEAVHGKLWEARRGRE
jgi:hypothetical protein